MQQISFASYKRRFYIPEELKTMELDVVTVPELENHQLEMLSFFEISPPFLVSSGLFYSDICFFDLYGYCPQLQRLLFKQAGIKKHRLQKIPYRAEEIIYLADEVQQTNMLQRKIITEVIRIMITDIGFYQYQLVEKIQDQIFEEYKKLKLVPVFKKLSSEKQMLDMQKAQQHQLIRRLFNKNRGFVPEKSKFNLVLDFEDKVITQPMAQELKFGDLSSLFYIKTQPILEYSIYDVFDFVDVKLLLYYIVKNKEFENVKYLTVFSPYIRRSWLIDIKKIRVSQQKPAVQLDSKIQSILSMLDENYIKHFMTSHFVELKNVQCYACSLEQMCKSNYQYYMPVKLI